MHLRATYGGMHAAFGDTTGGGLPPCQDSEERVAGRHNVTSTELSADHLKAQRRSRLHLRTYKTWWQIKSQMTKRAVWLQIAASLLAAAAAAVGAIVGQDAAEKHFADPVLLQSLSSWLVGLGAALVGASTIGASMILFAMQVNVERMPHGLFRRLSRDPQLMITFSGSFLLAVSIAAAGLAPSSRWASAALAYAAWGSIGVLTFLLFAYTRALDLVNPIRQLAIITRDARRQLKRSISWAERLEPLVDDASLEWLREKGLNTKRLAFFDANKGWDDAARRGVAYAVSYARRFGETGDPEVSGAALVTVIAINRDYLAAKQKTFVASNPFVDLPLSNDGFITETLEYLRRLSEAAVGRGDEGMTIGVFRAMAGLAALYCTIDYGKDAGSKTHAVLAGAYLRTAVKAASGKMGADVLMDGARQLGATGVNLVQRGGLSDAISLIEDLGMLTMLCSIKRELRPGAQQAVQQLAEITLALLQSGGHDIRFSAKRLIATVAGAALQALGRGDVNLGSDVGFDFEPYYSMGSFSSLHGRLNLLVNATLARAEGDEEAKRFIGCMTQWAGELFEPQKQLLVEAVKRRSSFAHDVLGWNLGMAEFLIALANAPATEKNNREALHKSALLLSRTPGWLPTDRETVQFLEAYGVTEELFSIAAVARYRDAPALVGPLLQQLLTWTLDAGAHLTGWGILDKGLSASAAVLLIEKDEALELEFLAWLTAGLAKPDAPDFDQRSRAASSLLRLADQPAGQFEISRAKVALDAAPRGERHRLLGQIVALLDPTAKDEGPFIPGDAQKKRRKTAGAPHSGG
jgi:hypothetical protein